MKIVFDPVAELHCEFHRTSLKRGRSDMIFLIGWKAKKSTINSKNNDYNCFQYAIAVILNYAKI